MGQRGARGDVEKPWRISLDSSYVDANQLVRGTHREQQLEDPDVLGVRNLHYSWRLGLAYDFSTQFTAGVVLPYIYNRRWEDHNHIQYDEEGLGDITVYGRYWLPQTDHTFNSYMEFSVALPTGEANKLYQKGDGTYADEKPYIVTGLGVVSPSVALGFDKSFVEGWLDGITAYGRGQFTMTIGRNSAGYASSDPLVINLGSAYSVKGLPNNYVAGFFTQANFTLNKFAKEKRHGKPVGNTGGIWVDIEPGIWFSPNGGDITFSVSVPVNVHYDVNSLQCFAPWYLNAGVSFRF